MTLFVHRAERADRLVAGLAELLADPLPDVFAEEVVAVPAKGTERWLAQQLSLRLGRRDGRADGICAGGRFPHPSAVVADVHAIVYVRGKRPPEKVLQLAREKGIPVLATTLGMFDCCGILHRAGLKGAM